MLFTVGSDVDATDVVETTEVVDGLLRYEGSEGEPTLTFVSLDEILLY